MLQLAIQRQATFFPVVGKEWGQCENFAEGGAGCYQVTADKEQNGSDRIGCTKLRPRLGLQQGPGVNPGQGTRPVASIDPIARVCRGPRPGP